MLLQLPYRIRSGTRQSFDTTDESTKVGRLPLQDFERQVVGWVKPSSSEFVTHHRLGHAISRVL